MVKVRIEHMSGPLQGQFMEFEEADATIKVGRDPDCQVLYPADLTQVSSRHADLKWDAGFLELFTNTRNPVSVDGQAWVGMDGLELRDGSVIQLGADGPRFSIHYLRSSGLPATVVGQVPSRDDAEVLQKLSSRNRWLIAATTLLAVFVVGAVWYSNQQFEGAIAKAKKSVYLVLVRSEMGEDSIGTAWVASEEYLATNAHVADAVDRARSLGWIALVRSTGSPSVDLQIVDTVYHPAYGAFYEAFYNAHPIRLGLNGEESEVQYVGGYDVALLRVDDPGKLAPPIPIASRERLEAVGPGLPVACIGFPTAGLAVKDISAPTFTSQTASIVGVTTFTRTRPTEVDGQLLEHSIPAIGGYSGGPIITKRGEVIGLLNGGNTVWIPPNDGNQAPREKWMPMNNAALVNFGQRADVLLDLMEHGPSMDLEPLRAGWLRDFGRYSRGVAEAQAARAKALLLHWADGAEPVRVASEVFSITSADRLVLLGEDLTAKGIELRTREGNYFVIATADNADDLDLVVTEPEANPGSIIAEDRTVSRVEPANVSLMIRAPRRLRVIVEALPTWPGSGSDQAGLTSGTTVRLSVWRLPLAMK